MARQARLRKEYAEWYPHLAPARWQLASTVRRIVLRQLRQGSPHWKPGPRILSDEHFEFRGSSSAGDSQVRNAERRVATHVPLRSPILAVPGGRPEPDGSSH